MNADLTKDYNTFFQPNMCHVCKVFNYNMILRRCTKCWMIAYCSVQHQKHDWPQHKAICLAIRQVHRTYPLRYQKGFSRRTWEIVKETFMSAVGRKLDQRLHMYQMEMFMRMKECVTCYEKRYDQLKDCEKCTLCFCERHRNHRMHTDVCNYLALTHRFEILQLLEIKLNVDMSYLKYFPGERTYEKMGDVINFIYRDIPDSAVLDLLMIRHSLLLTYPLSVYSALETLKYVPQENTLVVHFLSAMLYDEDIMSGWEVLLHMYSGVETLIMIMLGPSSVEYCSIPLCDHCTSLGKSCSFQFYNWMYDTYVASKHFIKPHILVDLNADSILNSYQITNIGLKLMRNMPVIMTMDCPFIMTCRRKCDLEEAMEKLKVFLGLNIKYVKYGNNPFAGLYPYRVPFGEERIAFDNNYRIMIEL